MSQNNVDTVDGNWTTVTKNPKQQKENVVKKKSKVTEDKHVSTEPVSTESVSAEPISVPVETETKPKKYKPRDNQQKVDTEWNKAFTQVYSSYLEYIKDRYSVNEVKNRINSAMYIIDKRTGGPANHVFLDVRKWSSTIKEDREQIEVEEVNGYKFVLNRFFDDRDFVRDLKDHFRTYGFSIGFQKRKNQNHFDYLGIKCYFRDN